MSIDLYDYQASIFSRLARGDIVAETEDIFIVSGGQTFAIKAAQISEVIALPKTTLIPGSKDWVLGIGNFRGVALPVIDFNRWKGNAATGGVICLLLASHAVAVAATLGVATEGAEPLDINSLLSSGHWKESFAADSGVNH